MRRRQKPAAAAARPLQDKRKPFIEAHCTDCHGEDTQKAGLRLDTLAADFRNEKSAEIWAHMFDKNRQAFAFAAARHADD